jgi:hypothetical protein
MFFEIRHAVDANGHYWTVAQGSESGERPSAMGIGEFNSRT